MPRIDDRSQAPAVLLASRYPRGGTGSLALLFMLGAWLLASPSVLGYADHAQALSDRISGVAILVLAFAATITRRPWIAWIAGAVGLWLVLAPVVLWSPSAAAYIGGTLTGILVALEGVVLPLSWRLPGDDVPAGWSYNPSSWNQRVPVVLLAGGSAVIAGYLAAYQLGYVDAIRDPVFGAGSMRVLDSEVSRAWPVSDAALGASMFVLDLLMTCAGDRKRWRTMPWLVIVFGVMIVPVGIVSIVLVILQPVAVGAWCSWCLLTAAATLAMIPLAIDEVTATLQLLRHTARRGESWWRVLWRGEHRGAMPSPLPRPRARALPPWGLVVMALAGAWLMLQPAILGGPPVAADALHITGALVIVVAAIAVSELARPLRFLGVPLALWIATSPWLLETTAAARISGLVTAFVIAVASWPRGPIAQHRGSADRIATWPSSVVG